VAEHAALRGSGRVGRSAAGRALSEAAVTSAVVASVRHLDTPYDRLLMSGVPRREARARIDEALERVLRDWRGRSSRPEEVGEAEGEVRRVAEPVEARGEE
ncbi:DUF2293 domain-containing protein, partial [Streptomyces sp. SID4982]|uniref:DUF2293 domain-containing protein n=1 Tax=Streptomyces sp. SID4982 TaxID=2690291 RepID=UPI001367E5B5